MKEFIWNLKIKLQMNDSLEVTRKLELLAIRLLDFLFFFFFCSQQNFFFIFIGILLIYNVMLVSNTQQINFFSRFTFLSSFSDSFQYRLWQNFE